MAKQKVQAKRTPGQANVSRNDDKLDSSLFAMAPKKKVVDIEKVSLCIDISERIHPLIFLCNATLNLQIHILIPNLQSTAGNVGGKSWKMHKGHLQIRHQVAVKQPVQVKKKRRYRPGTVALREIR